MIVLSNKTRTQLSSLSMSQTHNPKLYYECKYNKLNRLCVNKEIIKSTKLNMNTSLIKR